MPEPTRRPTQRDVAERAGVSAATVSYVLSGRQGRTNPVSEETRRRVLSVVAELGYQTNHAARSLRRDRTDLVCVVYRPPSNPWVEELIEQLHDSAVDRGYSVVTAPVASRDRADTALRVLRERFVDGAIIAPDPAIDAHDIRALASGGLPLVVFDDVLAARRLDVVRLAQASACRSAVSHLIERGHRRIAYLAHDEELAPGGDGVKYAAYRQALAEHDIPLDPALVVPGADFRPEAYAQAQKLLRQSLPPTAVFCASDRGAINAVWAAKDAGLQVPQDLAVIGVGNTREGESVQPALTTVGAERTDFTDAIDALWERIGTPALPGRELLQPWRLVPRESV